MKSETDPITDDEWLLRRVHKDRFRTDKLPIISPTAFEPRVRGRDPDMDGISLYRQACLSSAQEILATIAEDKRSDQGIVRIQAKTIRDMKLSIQPSPDAQIKGHVAIPELNAGAYETSKTSWRPVLLDLATIASQEENIVLTPAALD